MIFYIILSSGLLGAGAHLLLCHGPKTRARILETVLAYLFLTWVGANALLGFVGHLFQGPVIAARIGWPSGSPFQLEMAFANLSYGVLGVLAFWIRGRFWWAVLVGYTLLLWGAAGVHLWDLRVHHNTSPYNAGIMLYLDLLIPLTLWALFLDYRLSLYREGKIAFLPEK